MKNPIFALLSYAFVIFLLPSFATAQASGHTLIFRISADEAATLYRHETEDVYSEPYLYRLIDSFQRSAPVLPVGHYLFVKAEEEALRIVQHSVHRHQVVAVGGTDELRLDILDESGKVAPAGRILFNEKEVLWDEDLALFRHHRPRESGWLRVELPGDTMFYRVEHQKLQPQRKNFLRTPFGYLLSTPYRWAANTYRYFKRGITRGNWHLNWRRIWPFPRRNRQLKGYIAFSQPRYRPGDTLRVKAYLTQRNGRPWRDPVTCEILGYRNQKVISRALQPLRAGAFTTEVVLSDTLKLDHRYRIQFFVPEQTSKYGIRSETFLLEDYQLDAATFTFTTPEKTYRAGTPIRFELGAEDRNANPLPGANVELIALRQTVTDIGPDSLLIPDTLWTHRQDLSLRERDEVRFPDSLLPPANLGILVKAFFATAGGESEEKSISLRYAYRKGEFRHALNAGAWLFRYVEDDSSRRQTATLVTQRNFHPYADTTSIELPLRLPLDPTVTRYRLFSTGGVQETIDVGRQAAPVNVIGQHLGDSLIVRLDNPHGVRVRYRLYAGRDVIEESEVDTSKLLVRPARANALYQFDYQYVWAGTSRSGEQSFRTYKRQLQLTADLPDRIYPGQTVQVKVKVTDHKARPADGVELAAGAVNGQFNSREHLSPPQITYKKKKKRHLRHRYDPRRAANQHYSPISERWYRHLRLDTLLYYNIRYPERGVFTQYDSLSADSFFLRYPQISPYVVKDGQLQDVYLIYLNRELVYSHLSEDRGPYAFTARPGYNQLQIRTFDAVYRVDSVWVEPGRKLSFALDAGFYGYHPEYGLRIRRTPAPDHLTQAEISLLNRVMFRIRKEEKNTVSYLMADSGRVFRWPEPSRNAVPRVIGPVKSDRMLTYVQTDGLENTFLYEAGYQYEIRADRERLYAHQWLSPRQKHPLVKPIPHPAVDDRALTVRDIVRVGPDVRRVNFRKSWQDHFGARGALQFFYNGPGDSTLAAVSLQNSDGSFSIYPPRERLFGGLPPGYYELRLITEAGFTASQQCWIYTNQLTLLDLRDAVFTRDTSLQVFDDLYSYTRSKPSFIQLATPKSNRYHNPYEGSGYLANGVITDENGEPLIGASILLVGTSVGTVTDIDGSWSMWIPNAEAELAISYTGFQTSQLIAAKAEGNFALDAGDFLLEEVVVTGYSVPLVQQDNTTAGSTISAAQIRSLPTRNIEALAATTAGIRMVDDGDRLNVRGSRDDATDYYVDGVRVAGASSPGDELSGGGLRTDFRDYGFWQPDLITDRNGEAYFQTTFPDDVTNWQSFVLGMDDRRRGGAWYGETRAFQPVLAQLFLPRFLLPGDEIDLVGSSVNYTNDSLAITTRLEVDGETLLQENHVLVDGITDAARFVAPAGRDSLTAKYTLQTANYLDGEERAIPYFRVGTEETIGGFHALEGDTSLQLAFDPADGPITIYAQPNLLDVMLEEMTALIEYPYGCNEQSASRLLALLMQKEVYALTGRPFAHEAAIQKMIALLRQRQLPDGSWGWWGGSPRNHWMTVYVLRALHAAKEAGYATEAYEKGLVFLTNQFSSLTGTNRLQTLALFSEIGQNMDYAALLEPYDTLPGLDWTTLTATLVRAQQGLPYQLDTLNKYRKETLFGGHYWGNPGYGFYHNREQYSLLAYRVLRTAGRDEALRPVRRFFAEQRHRTPGYHWRAGYRNTFEAAMILNTILPDLMSDYPADQPADFRQRLKIEADDIITWDSLPRGITLETSRAVTVRKTGVGTTYFTAYQRRWNERPERVEGDFIVTGELRQGGSRTQRLEASRAAELRVELKVEKASDYVLLEIPIPAGCSYGRKRNNYGYYRGRETHREYFRDKVAVFYEHLEPGTYTVTVELEPRFTGRFQLNPAKAEQMYFPVFYGREGMKRVKIE